MSVDIAVVPLARLDESGSHALDVAGRLASRVLAVHVRGPESHVLQEGWARRTPGVPLVIVDDPADGDGWTGAFVRTVLTLRRTEPADQIAVVVADRRATQRLRADLEATPGVSVRAAPLPLHGA
jgi:hypothetical protein